jgi:hypothetical protein
VEDERFDQVPPQYAQPTLRFERIDFFLAQRFVFLLPRKNSVLCAEQKAIAHSFYLD